MTFLLPALALFFAGYLVNIFYITVLYHRGLTHNAVQLRGLSRWLVQHTGMWITGLDPKAWACMHRLHHQHSDTELDPHSPHHQGVFGLALGQLHSYERILRRLIIKDRKMLAVVADITFDVSILNKKRLWFMPYVVHLAIGIGVAIAVSQWWMGLSYFLGIMSHPVQGWMVNALAHRFGYQNFESGDESKNNFLVSLLVFGEGLQNNHHTFPHSANFAKKWFELDLGYWLCRGAAFFGILRLRV